MNKLIIRRRGLLKAGIAASTAGVSRRAVRAQAKLAPPNIIKAGTLVMSINPDPAAAAVRRRQGPAAGHAGRARQRVLQAARPRARIHPHRVRHHDPGLAAKRWDMINTGIFWTEERSKLMYMVPYEQAAISFLVGQGQSARPEDGRRSRRQADLRRAGRHRGAAHPRGQRHRDQEGPEARHGHDLQQFRRGLPGAEGGPVGCRDLHRRHGQVPGAARRLHPRDLGRVPADRLLRARQQGRGRRHRRRAERAQEERHLRQAARPVRRAESRRADILRSKGPVPPEAPA